MRGGRPLVADGLPQGRTRQAPAKRLIFHLGKRAMKQTRSVGFASWALCMSGTMAGQTNTLAGRVAEIWQTNGRTDPRQHCLARAGRLPLAT